MDRTTQHWIDHLVLAVPSLDRGIDDVAAILGVAPAPGGAHPGAGTHNALLSLGARTYLEVIAPDPEQPEVAERSFGVDATAHSQLVAFAVGCADIDATVALLRDDGYDDVADPYPMTRRRPDGTELGWRLSRIGGRLGGAHPFLISWDGGASPATDSPAAGRLLSLRAGARDPAAAGALLATLGVDVGVEGADSDWLDATIDTPTGPVTLR